ncbi:UbiA prenyltransferase family protein [Flavobacterium rhizosphaerae]|uniref:Prenyltransferase n=1 Tax=Flavobacterium rhizosphaerae TaxID=3163298 RepID=A0ABW8Z1B8_9FLAO
MNLVQRLFYIYIHGSIHVALAVLSLVFLTNHTFGLEFDPAVSGFAFFGTVFGYNFIKYEEYLRLRQPFGNQPQTITVLSVFSLIAGAACFFLLGFKTQLTAALFGVLAVFYAVPISKRGNLRSLAGIKIYIVALCWGGVTVLMPLVNAGLYLGHDAWLKFAQRFLLVIILILIFEIIDISEDDPLLETVPQQIGVKKTKLLNLFLLLLFYGVEFLKARVYPHYILVNTVIVLLVALFTIFATPNRSKYYTLFWVESIPVFWYALVVVSSW